MRFGEFKDQVKIHLLDAGDIFGTEDYLHRSIRVAVLEAFSYFPTLRPDKLWMFSSAEAVTDGNASVIGLPSRGVQIAEVMLIPSGWAFSGTGEAIDASISATGVLNIGMDEGVSIVLLESGDSGWETDRPYYTVNIGSNTMLSLYEGGEPLVPNGASDIQLKTVVREEYRTSDRLGPFERIAWEDRFRMINGLIARCDLLYALSPDRNTMLVHPIIDFEKILQVHYTGFETSVTDNDILNIPEGLEDRFISACADYVRSRVAKDIDRDSGLASVNYQEFKRSLRSMYKEVPR